MMMSPILSHTKVSHKVPSGKHGSQYYVLSYVFMPQALIYHSSTLLNRAKYKLYPSGSSRPPKVDQVIRYPQAARIGREEDKIYGVATNRHLHALYLASQLYPDDAEVLRRPQSSDCSSNFSQYPTASQHFGYCHYTNRKAYNPNTGRQIVTWRY